MIIELKSRLRSLEKEYKDIEENLFEAENVEL